MIVRPSAFDSWLREHAATVRAVIIYGSNHGLIQHYARALQRHYLGAEHADDAFRFVPMDGATLKNAAHQLLDEVRSPALDGTSRLIWIKNGGDFLTKPLEQLADIATDNALIITCERLDKRSSLRRLAERTSDLAIVACYDEQPSSLTAYIDTVVREHGKTIDAQARSFLVRSLNSERLDARNQLDKILLYSAFDESITLAMCEACLTSHDAVAMNPIAFAVALKDRATLGVLLDKAQEQGLAMPSILRSVAYHFMRLYQCLAWMQDGVPLAQTLYRLKPPVFFRDEDAFKKQLTLWSVEGVHRAIALLTESEIVSKSGETTSPLQAHRHLMSLATR
ncbi:MAG: DNA polymerase III subunit delta [Alphaproteobacteria bacterium GM202ARS2]|nr:DNA polymerase III subunit delta [Alphaproteobacteria bacterium GM202ARS2]